jgi:predicted alpha/beta superfamily hydrolase
MKPAFTLRSPQTDTDYRIFISKPKPETDVPLTAMLFLDGDDQFSFAKKAHLSVVRSARLPPLLLVGIGYGASYTKPGNRRGRDYTPTAHSDEPTSGGAGAFLDFLKDTLWPELTRRYPLRDDVRGIGGHSLGSLFVLYALWQESPFFTHHLASAPSIWWDNRSILQLAAERHQQNPTLESRLFLSVGEADTASMTADLTLLEQQLRDRPFAGLQVVSRRFPGRTHFNVMPDAFQAGLTSLFEMSPSEEKV